MQATEEYTCDVCGCEAELFQVDGDFCLHCWQTRTLSYA